MLARAPTSSFRSCAAVLLGSKAGPVILTTHLLSLVKASTDNRDLKSGKTIHAFLLKLSNCELVLTNAIINLYAKCCRTDYASRMFDAMPVRNVVSYSAMMAGYLHCGQQRKVLEVSASMGFYDMGTSLNEYTCATTLTACTDLGALGEGRQCHGYILKSGLISYPYVKNTLLCMYLSCSGLHDSFKVFNDGYKLDVYSCNSMVNGFLDQGYVEEALRIFLSILPDMDAWDHVSFVTALGLCGRLKDLNFGKQIHGQVIRRGGCINVSVGSGIVDMYGKCRDILGSFSAFDGSHNRNIIFWTAMMAAYAQNGFFEEALKLYATMTRAGVLPNEYTFAVVLNSCANLPALRFGDNLKACVEKLGFKEYLIINNELINMYSKSGSLEDAEKIFFGLHNPDIISWNSMLVGYSLYGLGSEGLNLFHRMLMEGEYPNYVTFVGLLSACSHLGLVDYAFYYMNNLMRDAGITPGIEHFTCMIRLLCRAGLVDEADRFMKTTPIVWDVFALRTLLDGCLKHKYYNLAREVEEKILQINPMDTGTFILSSNMYAKEDKWDKVGRIRKLMRERDIKKEPGVSWIQMQHKMHIFTSEHRIHPKVSQVYVVLSELLKEMKYEGYEPDSSDYETD